MIAVRFRTIDAQTGTPIDIDDQLHPSPALGRHIPLSKGSRTSLSFPPGWCRAGPSASLPIGLLLPGSNERPFTSLAPDRTVNRQHPTRKQHQPCGLGPLSSQLSRYDPARPRDPTSAHDLHLSVARYRSTCVDVARDEVVEPEDLGADPGWFRCNVHRIGTDRLGPNLAISRSERTDPDTPRFEIGTCG